MDAGRARGIFDASGARPRAMGAHGRCYRRARISYGTRGDALRSGDPYDGVEDVHFILVRGMDRVHRLYIVFTLKGTNSFEI